MMNFFWISIQLKIHHFIFKTDSWAKTTTSAFYTTTSCSFLSSDRKWGTRNHAALKDPNEPMHPYHMLASSLIGGGMNWWQAIHDLLGNTIVLIPMILNGHAGAKYGIPFPVLWGQVSEPGAPNSRQCVRLWLAAGLVFKHGSAALLYNILRAWNLRLQKLTTAHFFRRPCPWSVFCFWHWICSSFTLV